MLLFYLLIINDPLNSVFNIYYRINVMTVKDTLLARADNKCELCSGVDNLDIFEVGPTSDGTADQSALLCSTCRHPERTDMHHWRCLSDSMWTPVPAVQVGPEIFLICFIWTTKRRRGQRLAQALQKLNRTP